MGKLVICGDPDLGDEYLCETMRLAGGKSAPGTNAIVRVLRVLTYPAQRAVIWVDVPTEIPAVDEGTVCRLRYLRDATDEEAFRHPTYAGSLRESIINAMRDTHSTEERMILMRHMMGVHKQERVLTTFMPGQVQEDTCGIS